MNQHVETLRNGRNLYRLLLGGEPKEWYWVGFNNWYVHILVPEANLKALFDDFGQIWLPHYLNELFLYKRLCSLYRLTVEWINFMLKFSFPGRRKIFIFRKMLSCTFEARGSSTSVAFAKQPRTSTNVQ